MHAEPAALYLANCQPGARPDRPAVVINGRFYAQPITGVQRYAREIVLALDELLDEAAPGSPEAHWRVQLAAPADAQLPPLRRITLQRAARLRGQAWEQFALPLATRGALLWNLANTGPLLARRQLLTVHDAAVLRRPETYGRAFRLWYRLLLGRLVPRVPGLMTVSDFSASELVQCFGARPGQARVSHEGWQHLLRAAPDDSVLHRHGLLARPFLLAVSSPTPNKNFAAIVQALHLLGERAPACVVVGSADPRIFGAGALPPGLTAVGRIGDGALRALYQHALGFVFPSFYEGFGLPPLEAMSQGCPVLASTAGAVREVCGDAALYFDPAQPAMLAAQIRRLVDAPGLARALRTAGLQRAQAFSWRQAASLHLQAMAEMLATPAGVPRPAAAPGSPEQALREVP